MTGPGHGGPGMVANAYLDGTYTEVYNMIDKTEEGLRRLFRQFSFPGGIPSHAAAQTPGSIHEGGELGYSLSHAYGAAFDNPGLLVAAVGRLTVSPLPELPFGALRIAGLRFAGQNVDIEVDHAGNVVVVKAPAGVEVVGL